MTPHTAATVFIFDIFFIAAASSVDYNSRYAVVDSAVTSSFSVVPFAGAYNQSIRNCNPQPQLVTASSASGKPPRRNDDDATDDRL